MAKAQFSTLEMQDGTRLHCADYFPSSNPHSAVVFMHGLGEHSGRYEHVAAFFCAHGYAVRSYDHRGHGKSQGERGDIPHHTALLDDAHEVIRHWQANCPQSVARHLLLGHSMGGLFAAKVASCGSCALDGLVLSAPALAIRMNVIQRALLKILSSLAPGLTLSNGLETTYLSHDPKVIASYRNDDLVHGRISARLLNSMLDAMTDVHIHAAALTLPTVLLVAGDDRLVDSSGSLKFAQACPKNVLRLHTYETLYHELFNELHSSDVFDDVSAWLEQLPAKVAP